MKPRSKIEKQMLALAAKLPPITEKQKQYAYGHCFQKRAVIWPKKHKVRCMCCGQSYIYEKTFIDSFLRENLYDCPYCGKSMPVERNSPDIAFTEFKYFTVITTFKGYQVARTWEVSRENYRNENLARFSNAEIFQIWITPEGKEVITGLQLHRSFNSTTWDYHKPLNIRKHNGGGHDYYVYDDIYEITGNFLYPIIRVTPIIRRNGWNSKLLDYKNMIPLTDALRWLLSVPTAEMLVKTGQYDLFLYMLRCHGRQLPFLHAVRIANRHNYIVKDAQMWIDMLQMASELGKDTHNPQIVCPSNLRKAHDALLAPVSKLREKRNKEKKLKEAVEWEALYKTEKSRFFNITIGNDDFTINVIKTVAEIAEEGKAMHHCVFAAGYYKKADSLILSARDKEGIRLETIEVNLRSFEIIQSRARFNGTSPYHAEILNLLENNMHLIRQAACQGA